MTQEELIISVVRVAGSLLVLRWAFVGGIVAVLVDFSDLFLKNLLDLGGVRDYQEFDKYLDQVYMLAFLAVAMRWRGPARSISIALYLFRLAGFFAFEVTGARGVLLFFPNVFEFWFLFVASLPHWRPGFRFGRRQVAVVMAILLPLKEFQEYVLHEARWLDRFTAVEAVQAIWDWLTP
ncbi:MAG: hypothetical protein HY875_01615 [Chloroflexi bacterium]|nr:hypothetical protein [Chloroflexota bacterium]